MVNHVTATISRVRRLFEPPQLLFPLTYNDLYISGLNLKQFSVLSVEGSEISKGFRQRLSTLGAAFPRYTGAWDRLGSVVLGPKRWFLATARVLREFFSESTAFLSDYCMITGGYFCTIGFRRSDCTRITETPPIKWFLEDFEWVITKWKDHGILKVIFGRLRWEGDKCSALGYCCWASWMDLYRYK